MRASALRKGALALALTASLTAALMLSSRRADAFERQWHAGADLGYTALLFSGGTAGHGLGGGLHLAYGINDSLNLHGEITTSYAPSGGWLFAGGGAGV